MRLVSFALAVAVTSAVPAAAQAPQGGAFTKAAQQQFENIYALVLRATEKVPDEVYAFRPTPEVRTFAGVVGHIADGNVLLCTAASGVKPTITREHEKQTTKADVVAALKASKMFCDKVLDSFTDETVAVPFAAFGGNGQPRLSWIHANNSHMWEHYGNLVTYMRLKQIVPPSSER